MTMPPEPYPPLAPPFLPPVEVPIAQPRRKRPPWLPWLVIALAPVVAICTAVGAYTMAKAAITASSPRVVATNTAHTQPAKVHHSDPPAPKYDLAGYQAVTSGSQEQAFVAALNQFRSDARHYKFQSLSTDSLSLTQAASSWLAALRRTTPPPGYQASKLSYILAATLAERAATTTQGAITDSDLNALAQGSSLATQAKQAMARAAESAPQGS